MNRPFVLLSVIFSALLSFAITNLIIVQFNTLDRRKQWFTPRTQAVHPVNSANSEKFAKATISLAGGELNLGIWHGHQIVETSEFHNFEKIRILFKLDPASAFYITLKNQSMQTKGIRYSNTHLFKPMKYDLDSEEKFINKVPFGDFIGTDWQTVELTPQDFGFNKLQGPFKLQMRNEYLPVRVSKVELFDGNNSVVFSDGFYWKSDYLFYFLIIFFSVLLVNILFATKQGLAFSILTFNLVGIIVVGLFWASSFFYFSRLYPAAESRFAPPTLEVNNRWTNQTPTQPENVDSYFTAPKPYLLPKLTPQLKRVIFLGSSQTEGEGATKVENIWPSRVCEHLKTKSKNLICLNLAKKGSRAVLMLDALGAQDIGPNDLVFFNMGNNDRIRENFEGALTRMLNLIERTKAHFFIIYEPNNPQVNSSKLVANHEVLAEVCKSHKWPCFDMHRYLMRSEFYDSGHMWQDHVHATNYTHRLMSEALIKVLDN
jgi:lysophospholipase L1-like esterase